MGGFSVTLPHIRIISVGSLTERGQIALTDGKTHSCVPHLRVASWMKGAWQREGHLTFCSLAFPLALEEICPVAADDPFAQNPHFQALMDQLFPGNLLHFQHQTVDHRGAQPRGLSNYCLSSSHPQ